MPDDLIALRVDSADLSLRVIANAMDELADIVSDVSNDLLGGEQVVWLVETFSRNSPALIEARPRVGRGGNVDDLAESLVSTVQQGFSMLAGSAAWPPHFPERSLERIRSLSRRAGPAVNVQVGRPSSLVNLDSSTAAHIDRLLGPARGAMLGAVEGRLESLTIHNASEFSLYGLLDGRRIRCSFGARVNLDEVSPNIGKRVSVYGTISARQDGTIVSVIAESIEALPAQKDLPSYTTARGILDAI